MIDPAELGRQAQKRTMEELRNDPTGVLDRVAMEDVATICAVAVVITVPSDSEEQTVRRREVNK